jgi:hypothetical protein
MLSIRCCGWVFWEGAGIDAWSIPYNMMVHGIRVLYHVSGNERMRVMVRGIFSRDLYEIGFVEVLVDAM